MDSDKKPKLSTFMKKSIIFSTSRIMFVNYLIAAPV